MLARNAESSNGHAESEGWAHNPRVDELPNLPRVRARSDGGCPRAWLRNLSRQVTLWTRSLSLPNL